MAFRPRRLPERLVFCEKGSQTHKHSAVFPVYEGLRHHFVLALIAIIVAVFANYMTPQVIRVTVDSVINDTPFNLPAFLTDWIESIGGREFLRQNIVLCALASLLFALLSGVTNYLSRMHMAKGCEGTITRIRDRLFAHIQRLPYAWHNLNQTGDIIQRCTRGRRPDPQLHQRPDARARARRRPDRRLACADVLDERAARADRADFHPDRRRLLADLLRDRRNRFRVADEAEGKLTAIVQENLTGVRVVRAFGRERFEKDKFNEQNDLFSDLWVRLGRVMGLNWGLGDLLSGLQVITILAAGVFFVVNGSITEGEYLAFIAYNSMLVWPTRSLGRLLSELPRPASARSACLRSSTRGGARRENPVEPPMDRDIEFKNVNFSYGTTGEVLHDISFKIPAARRSASSARPAAARAH